MIWAVHVYSSRIEEFSPWFVETGTVVTVRIDNTRATWVLVIRGCTLINRWFRSNWCVITLRKMHVP